MSTTFTVSRPNGKSSQQVIIELVSEAEPGTVFDYDQFTKSLVYPGSGPFDRKRVQQIVRLTNKRLLREFKRLLRPVNGIGYTIAFAKDHVELAEQRNRKSVRQIKWAVDTLDNVRLDEMTDQQRAVHLGQQIINKELLTVQRRILRQQKQQSRVIANLTSRVEQMEAKHEKN